MLSFGPVGMKFRQNENRLRSSGGKLFHDMLPSLLADSAFRFLWLSFPSDGPESVAVDRCSVVVVPSVLCCAELCTVAVVLFRLGLIKLKTRLFAVSY